ncbi:type II secretion system protein [Cryobacterium glaciale]|uniref:Type II secretion system protein n=1 Tax=Cryobacterium glaciale TaxID=1259145 RepID=A0A4R8V3A9_9MICO|nr:type II secretion system protein [Cryobacterium glaciale]TFB75943.1 type II secretion system protein [Cryobacterium glaciale]
MPNSPCFERTEPTDECGFGVVEIVVAMFLIGILAVAFLPILVQSVRVTATNARLAEATQVVAQQLERVGAAGSSCSAVKAITASVPAAVETKRGSLQPHLRLNLPVSDVCAEPYLRVVQLRVWASDVGSTEELAAAETLILLDAP